MEFGNSTTADWRTELSLKIQGGRINQLLIKKTRIKDSRTVRKRKSVFLGGPRADLEINENQIRSYKVIRIEQRCACFVLNISPYPDKVCRRGAKIYKSLPHCNVTPHTAPHSVTLHHFQIRSVVGSGEREDVLNQNILFSFHICFPFHISRNIKLSIATFWQKGNLASGNVEL